MTKQEFLAQLQSGLLGLTESDAQERLTFYSEMIDDRMEEGLSEQDAVAQIGEIDEIVASILAEIPRNAPEAPQEEGAEESTAEEMAEEPAKAADPLPEKYVKPEKESKKENKKGLKPWQIVMLIVGAPLWVPLLIVAIAVIFALLVVLWSLVVCMWAVFGSLVGSAAGALVAGVTYVFTSEVLGGAVLLGFGIACIGLAIFAFYGSLWLTKVSAWLTRVSCKGINRLFFGRRDEE